MPLGMNASLILAIVHASLVSSTPWSWLAVGAIALSVVFTVAVNMPINLATGKWNPHEPPADWKDSRGLWEKFQGVRSWLLLAGFLLVCASVTLT